VKGLSLYTGRTVPKFSKITLRNYKQCSGNGRVWLMKWEVGRGQWRAFMNKIINKAFAVQRC